MKSFLENKCRGIIFIGIGGYINILLTTFEKTMPKIFLRKCFFIFNALTFVKKYDP